MAFEAAQDLASGLALGLTALGVGDGSLVDAEPGHGDAPQGVVGLAVSASVEAVTGGSARGRLDGAGAAQSSEGCVVAHPVGVVAGGDQQRSCDLGTDAARGEQSGVGVFAQAQQLGVELGDLDAERLVAPCQGAQCPLGCGLDDVGAGIRAQTGAGVHDAGGAQTSKPFFEVLTGGDQQAVDLVGGLGAGLDCGAACHAQHPDRLHRPVGGFGHCGGLAAERGTSRGLGVDGIGPCRVGGASGG